MMPSLLIAALPVAGIFIGAALQYLSGRSLEGRKQLSAQQAQAYIDYFRAVASLAQGRTPEKLALAADAKARICLYGSSRVVRRLAAFERTGATLFNDEGRNAVLEIVEAMRAHAGHSDASIPTSDLPRVLFGTA